MEDSISYPLDMVWDNVCWCSSSGNTIDILHGPLITGKIDTVIVDNNTLPEGVDPDSIIQ